MLAVMSAGRCDAIVEDLGKRFDFTRKSEKPKQGIPGTAGIGKSYRAVAKSYGVDVPGVNVDGRGYDGDVWSYKADAQSDTCYKKKS
jgi:hypothetical protein